MDRLANPPVATAEIPLLSGPRLALITAVKQDASYYSIAKVLARASSSILKIPGPVALSVDRTGSLAGITKKESTLWELLHAVPRDLLASLILGTVAFDFHRKQGRPAQYKETGAGVYVFGISVAQRQGKWLTARELTTVVGQINDYIAGYNSWKVHHGQPASPRDRQLQDLVGLIDNQFGWAKKPAAEGPRYVNTDIHESFARNMVDYLTMRVTESRKHDPSGNTPLIQSPCYVGCSTDVKQRMAKHMPRNSTTAPDGTNRMYLLLTSVMAHNGWEAKCTLATALRTWKKGQLADGEVLLSALASSYVHQGGFNLTEAGSHSPSMPSSDAHDALQYVHASAAFLHRNLSGSCDELRRRRDHIVERAKLAPLADGDVVDELDQILTHAQDLRRRASLMLDREEDFDAVLESHTQEVDHLVAATNTLGDVSSLMDQLLQVLLAAEGDTPPGGARR